MRKVFLLYIMGFTLFLNANILPEAGNIDSFWVWVALFLLALIGVIILFLSSQQMMTIRKLHKEMFDKQRDMEQSQSVFLTNMGENIYEMVEKKFSEVSGKIEEMPPQQKEQERKLIDVTNDLIEFLRIKSKKVEIIQEKFNLNNVLNQVAGSICASFEGSKIELIFDIENRVPRDLIGDALNLEKILNNLLEYTMNQVDSGEVKLEITMFSTFEKNVELQFKLSDNGAGLTHEEIDSLFIPYYDEENNIYSRLGLFVAQKLTSIMEGEVDVQSIEKKGTTFTLTLPFTVENDKEQRKYRLPEKILTEKKVFIVDSSYNSSLAIKKLFSYFKHEVKVVSKEQFVKSMYNLTSYDIVLLDESLFNIRTVEYLSRIKKEKVLKVVALSSLLNPSEKGLQPIVDNILVKPLNQERVFELIVDMYTVEVNKDAQTRTALEAAGARVHKTDVAEKKSVTQESFSAFEGTRLLIVEDNVINQKVLSNILSPAGIHMTIANNGREAVDKVKEGYEQFDLVLMDINMPVMDGYTATQIIRTEPKFDKLPIVAFTALALQSERQKIFNSGMNAYLTKPLNVGKLYTVFQMFVPKSKNVIDVPLTKQVQPIDGLDFQAGLSYSNNNNALYMEILREFSDAYTNSGELFEKLVNEQRTEQIKMLCLDMQGLTGTIGAKEMNKVIREVYQHIIYGNSEMLPSYIKGYRDELMKLTNAIEHYLDAHK